MSDISDFLALLMDVDAKQWERVAAAGPGASAQEKMEDLLGQLHTFINTYLMLNESNQLVVYGIHHTGSPLLFRRLSTHLDPSGGSTGGGEELLKSMQALLKVGREPGAAGAASLSGALSRALCLVQSAKDRGSFKAGLRPRILVLRLLPDSLQQYVPVMNAIFSAQRSGIPVDGLCLAEQHSAFLQQAAYLTGSTYIKLQDPNQLLLYLLGVFCIDTRARSFLRLPKGEGVDLRASCFCHKRPIELGFVCSVCLSVFCKRLRQCSTCSTPLVAPPAAAASSGAAASSQPLRR